MQDKNSHQRIKKSSKETIFLMNETGGYPMAKDSQIDNKEARKKKANGQTPLTRENQNQNRNAKKQSIRNDDV